MTASGRRFRHMALLGASDYFFHSRGVRWAVSPLMNVIPIDRHPGSKSLALSLETCRNFLERTGGCLILYPEGTRSTDGEMRAFKPGAGLFAIELGVPVVPAHIEGTHRILPKGTSVPRFGTVRVRFGEMLTFPNLSSSKDSMRNHRHLAVKRLEQSIRMLKLGHSAPELLVGVLEKR
jgi:1-acyl-sn-glycerol-3-phosphate acyltransferase